MGIRLRGPLLRDTLWLYLRMAGLLAVNLWVTRILLEGFGVSGFGVWSVVMSAVMLWAFLTETCGEVAMRYLSVALGEGSPRQEIAVTFTNFLRVNVGAIILMTAGAIGGGLMWLSHGAQVDAGEGARALLPVLALMLAFKSLNVPFQSWLVAHERFGAYVILSLAEGAATLGAALAVSALCPAADRMQDYAWILVGVEVAVLLMYVMAVRGALRNVAHPWQWRPALVREAVRYMAWVLTGGVAVMVWTEGMTLLVNRQFGLEATAACAIAMGLLTKLRGFCANFQRAAVPRIIKTYASGHIRQMLRLVTGYSLISFGLVIAITLPLLIFAPWWLEIWLGEVPPHLVTLTRIIIVAGWIEVFHTPVNAVIHATGRIKTYQVVDGALLLLIVPVAWGAAAVGWSLPATFSTQLWLLLTALIARLFIASRLIRKSKSS